jgi:protocatechuate 3,4-dioxygenase beta subunit
MRLGPALSLWCLAAMTPAQDPPPLLGDHVETTSAVDREHAHHASFDGRVLDAGGVPATGARVYLCAQQPWCGSLMVAAATADAEGRYRIADVEAVGQLALFATTARGAPFASAWRSVGLASGRSATMPTLTLSKPAAVAAPHTFRGRLVDASGAPVPGALWRLHHEASFDPGACAATDADGRFEIHTDLGRPVGATLFLGRSKLDITHVDGTADLGDGGRFQDLDLVTERTIRAPSAVVLAVPADGAEGAIFCQERGYQLVRCAGNAAIGSRSTYGGDRVEVWASAPGHLPRPRVLPGGSWGFAEDRERSLRVVDGAGAPVAGARVDVCRAGEPLEEWTMATLRTGDDGALAVQAPADEYVVYVYADGFAPARARWRTEGAPEIALARCTARLEIGPGGAGSAVYVRRAGTFASCAKLYPQGDAMSVDLVPGDYEVSRYGARGLEGAVAVHLGSAAAIAMPAADERPDLVVTVAKAAAGDGCWAYAGRSGVGGMISKWAIHSQLGGPMPRHEIVATVEELTNGPDADGARRFRVRPPTSGRYTLLLGNGASRVRFFREAVFGFGRTYAIELPAATETLKGTVAKYPESWTEDFAHDHGVVGPRLCLEPLGSTPFGVLVALPEPAEFRIESLLPGTFALHHHLYATGLRWSAEGTWGGRSVALGGAASGEAAGERSLATGNLARGPDAELTVQVRDRAGRPATGRLSIRDRMFECWADDLRQNTTLDEACDPIPTPPSAELADGKATLSHVRAGRLAFVLQRDDGSCVHFARDVEPGKTLEVVLDPAR